VVKERKERGATSSGEGEKSYSFTTDEDNSAGGCEGEEGRGGAISNFPFRKGRGGKRGGGGGEELSFPF